jgi:hypothetical protein
VDGILQRNFSRRRTVSPKELCKLESFFQTLLGCVITVLLGILTGQIVAVRKEQKTQSTTLTAHILAMQGELGKKVEIGGCRIVRGECVQLNKEIIVKPLADSIADVERNRAKDWERQRQENRTIWAAIRAHIHTDLPAGRPDKGVVLPPDGLPDSH